jgi:hypothetical protein
MKIANHVNLMNETSNVVNDKTDILNTTGLVLKVVLATKIRRDDNYQPR